MLRCARYIRRQRPNPDCRTLTIVTYPVSTRLQGLNRWSARFPHVFFGHATWVDIAAATANPLTASTNRIRGRPEDFAFSSCPGGRCAQGVLDRQDDISPAPWPAELARRRPHNNVARKRGFCLSSDSVLLRTALHSAQYSTLPLREGGGEGWKGPVPPPKRSGVFDIVDRCDWAQTPPWHTVSPFNSALQTCLTRAVEL